MRASTATSVVSSPCHLVTLSPYHPKISIRGANGTQGRVEKIEAPSGRWLACWLTKEHCLLLASEPPSPVSSSAPFVQGLPEALSGCRQIDVTSAYTGLVLLGPGLEEVPKPFSVMKLFWVGVEMV